MPLLLDTCAVIWLVNGDPISDDLSEALNRSYTDDEPVYVSPITAWEMAQLLARGRLSLMMSPQRWFDQVMREPSMRLAEMPPDVLIGSLFLPGTAPRDPADRILAATAREYRYVLATRDRELLDYADKGHMQSLAC